VRDALPQGAMLLPQLRDAALDRIRFAHKLFGPVTLENVVDVEPVWRPLLIALARQTGRSLDRGRRRRRCYACWQPRRALSHSAGADTAASAGRTHVR